MLYLLRHLVSIVLLPATVVILIPTWIARRDSMPVSMPASLPAWAAAAAGIAVGTAGLLLFAGSLHGFATQGRGTLAPWDPPRRLVVRGPYRYSRNPMIGGVLLILVAEALILRSWPLAAWAAAFALLNLFFILAVEEPGLEARFGDGYRAYRRAVPRFLPGRRRWPRDRA